MHFSIKILLLDHMYALYIQISRTIAFAAPKTMNLQHSKLPYLPTRSFVRLSWRYTLAVTETLVLYKKKCIDLNQFLVLPLHNTF